MPSDEIQIKQGHIYCKDDEFVSDIIKMDPTPLSFETSNASIAVDITYGFQHLNMLVDGHCTIGMLKARFNHVGEKTILNCRL